MTRVFNAVSEHKYFKQIGITELTHEMLTTNRSLLVPSVANIQVLPAACLYFPNDHYQRLAAIIYETGSSMCRLRSSASATVVYYAVLFATVHALS